MKYLKTFESNSNDPFYSKIDVREFYRLVGTDNLIPFSKGEIEKISDMVYDQNIVNVSMMAIYPDKEVRLSTTTHHVSIYKIEDEWHLIIFSGPNDETYFKCDQFEGLTQFIKDKVIISPTG